MRTKVLIVAGAVITLAAGYGLYSFGVMHGQRTGGSASSDATLRPGDIAPSTGRRIPYWPDPMVPGRRFEAPGKSPFMDMQLVPVYGDDADEGTVTISPRVQQNIGIRTADVVREQVAARLMAAGNVMFNERAEVLVQARAAGYV